MCAFNGASRGEVCRRRPENNRTVVHDVPGTRTPGSLNLNRAGKSFKPKQALPFRGVIHLSYPSTAKKHTAVYSKTRLLIPSISMNAQQDSLETAKQSHHYVAKYNDRLDEITIHKCSSYFERELYKTERWLAVSHRLVLLLPPGRW